MSNNLLPHALFTLLLIALSCGEASPMEASTSNDYEREKAAILAAINQETVAAFSRDYAGWQDHWVHAPYVAKTYLGFPDSTLSESLGWAAIDDFVRTYFAEHPEPDPLPDPLTDIDVQLYGSGAWVSYEQQDPARGRKRETRLMEKVDGQWKIAGMHTTIYGFEAKD